MRIALSNPDNIGDFILRQPMLSALHEAGHELLLVVRDFVAPAAEMVAPFAKSYVCPGDPYSANFTLDTPLGKQLVSRIRQFAPDVLIVASFQHTALEEQLAGALPGTDCLGFQGSLFQARGDLVVPSTIRFAARAAVPTELPELQKNEALCSLILGRSVQLDRPRIEPSPKGTIKALELLSREGLGGKPYWAVCAGDIAAKRLKNWDPSQWAEFLGQLLKRHDLQLLFLGTPEEHESTAEIRKLLGPAAKRTAALTDRPIDLPALTALLANASGYIGKDTGPMHMAAALGKPVLAVFGGGHWPRFVPAAVSGRVYTMRVPCAGCNWLCHLERSHCVKDIPVEAVLEGADAMLAGGEGDFQVHVLEPDSLLGAAIIRESWTRTRAEQQRIAIERTNFLQWHADRIRDIGGIQQQLTAVEQERDTLRRAAARLEDESAAGQQAVQQVSILTAERDRLAAERASILESVARFQTLSDAFDQMKARADALAERAEAIQFDNRLLTANIKAATEAKLEAEERYQRQRQRFVEKLSAARQAAAALREERDTTRAELDARIAREEEQAVLRIEQESLSRLLGEKALRINQLESQLHGQDSELRGRLADAELRLQHMMAEYNSGMALLPALRDDLAAANAALEESAGQLEELTRLRAEVEFLNAEAARLQNLLEVCEADRAARLVVIEALVENVRTAEQARAASEAEREAAEQARAAAEAEREAGAQAVVEWNTKYSQAEQERLKLLELHSGLQQQIAAIESDRADRLTLIQSLSKQLAEIEADRKLRGEQIDTLHTHIRHMEEERRALENRRPVRFLKALGIL